MILIFFCRLSLGVSQGVLHLYDDPDDIKGRIQRMLACSYGKN